MVRTLVYPLRWAKWDAVRWRWWWIVFGVSVLLVALALRLDVLVRAGWLLEGDDALAASYALFGASRLAAHLPELAASLAFVGTTWLLAREVGGPVAARFAALLMAVPPVYILVLSLKPFAPYTEVAVLGSLAL